jgi:hypothetical protein
MDPRTFLQRTSSLYNSLKLYDLPFFGSFVTHFKIKLTIYGSNVTPKFASMNELEFFLLTEVFTQNSSIVEVRKSKNLHSNQSSHIEDDII